MPGLAPACGCRMIVQFLKFGIVGVSNTLLAFAVYTLLLKVFGVWYVAASAIGFAVGAVNGFLLNRRWTFNGARRRRADAGALGGRAGLRAGWSTSAWSTCSSSGAGLDELVGQACATAIVTVLTFVANRSWTFRESARAVARRRSRSSWRLAKQREQRQARRGCVRRGRSSPPPASSGRSSSQLSGRAAPTGRGSTRSSCGESRSRHAQHDRDRQQQRVEVGGPHALPAGLLGDP